MKTDKEQAIEVLRKGRKEIEDPTHWIKGEAAATAEGAPVDPTDPRAVCFCAIGSVRKYSTEPSGRGMINTYPGLKAMAALRAAIPSEAPALRIPTFNDNPKTTHADILALFDRAIAQLENQA